MTDLQTVGVEIILGAVLILTAASVTAWALLRSARLQPGAMLGISVSLLTLVAILAAVMAPSSDGLATALVGLAGVGMGGLVTSLRSLFGDHNPLRGDTDSDDTGPDRISD